MKTKNLFLGMVAGLFMMACTNENDPVVDNKLQADEVAEVSYLAVSINQGGVSSRAEGDGDFVIGTEDENAISQVAFYFFDETGAPYIVDETASQSYKLVTDNGVESTGQNGDNVEKVMKAVLLIEKSQKAAPASIVAVVNVAAENLLAAPTLSQLYNSVGAYNTNTIGDVNYFVMTNSTYADGNAAVYSQALDIKNIAESPELATANPVKIYVERVAARVTTNGEASYVLEGEMLGETQLYAKILGWNIVSENTAAYLMKHIDATWTDAALGFTWNNPYFFRSYWAETTDIAAGTNKTFGEVTNELGGTIYTYENTSFVPQLIVAAQITDAEGNAVEVAEWNGERMLYGDLKTKIANALKDKLYKKNSDTELVSIAPEDITFEANDVSASEKRYLAMLSSEGTWYDKDNNVLTAEQVQAIMDDLRPASIWNNGYGYYYTSIRHLGDVGTEGAFGIVRNHAYSINLTSVTGLPTPVYDPNKIIIPEKKVDEYSYIAAQINVLSWRAVSQDVGL